MLLFALAALAEIGGAWPDWQGVREHRGWISMGARVPALGRVRVRRDAALEAHFGRILAAYGGVRSRLSGLRHGHGPIPAGPLRLMGALICLVGVSVIMYAPRA